MTAFEQAFDMLKMPKIPNVGEAQRLDWSDESGQDFDNVHWSGEPVEGQTWLQTRHSPSDVYVQTILSNIMGLHRDDPAEQEMTDEQIEQATKRISSTGHHEAIHTALEPIFREMGFSTPERAFMGDNREYNLGHEYGAIAGSTETPLQQYIQLLTHSTLGDYRDMFNERLESMFDSARKVGGGDKISPSDPATQQAMREWRGNRARANALEQDPSLRSSLS